jgi:hypothetical protein
MTDRSSSLTVPLLSAVILGSHKEIIDVWTRPFRADEDASASFKVLSTMMPPSLEHL